MSPFARCPRPTHASAAHVAVITTTDSRTRVPSTRVYLSCQEYEDRAFTRPRRGHFHCRRYALGLASTPLLWPQSRRSCLPP